MEIQFQPINYFIFTCNVFITIIFYSFVRMLEIRRKKKHLQHEIEEYAHHQTEKEKKKTEGEVISKMRDGGRFYIYCFLLIK